MQVVSLDLFTDRPTAIAFNEVVTRGCPGLSKIMKLLSFLSLALVVPSAHGMYKAEPHMSASATTSMSDPLEFFKDLYEAVTIVDGLKTLFSSTSDESSFKDFLLDEDRNIDVSDECISSFFLPPRILVVDRVSKDQDLALEKFPPPGHDSANYLFVFASPRLTFPQGELQMSKHHFARVFSRNYEAHNSQETLVFSIYRRPRLLSGVEDTIKRPQYMPLLLHKKDNRLYLTVVYERTTGDSGHMAEIPVIAGRSRLPLLVFVLALLMAAAAIGYVVVSKKYKEDADAAPAKDAESQT